MVEQGIGGVFYVYLHIHMLHLLPKLSNSISLVASRYSLEVGPLLGTGAG